jgi:hypothetical protein
MLKLDEAPAVLPVSVQRACRVPHLMVVLPKAEEGWANMIPLRRLVRSCELE